MNERFLRKEELLEVVRRWALQPECWQPLVRCLPIERWSGLLFKDAHVDVWLLSWPVETGTQLHDHGDAAGAFQVLAGELEELTAGRQLRRRRLGAGARVAFPAGAVHDVRNGGGHPSTSHAVSLHAYSPPLTSMTYYERRGTHLIPVRSEPVAAPAMLTLPAAARSFAGSAA